MVIWIWAVGIWFASAVSAGMIVTLIVFARGWMKEPSSAGPQHIHLGSTSRLGGCVFAGFVIAVAFAFQLNSHPVPPCAASLLIAALPVHAAGLLRDITRTACPQPTDSALRFSPLYLASAIAQGVHRALICRSWTSGSTICRLPYCSRVSCVVRGVQRIQHNRRHQWTGWRNMALLISWDW